MPGPGSGTGKDGNGSGQPRRGDIENGEDGRQDRERYKSGRGPMEGAEAARRGMDGESRDEIRKRKYSPIVWDKLQGGRVGEFRGSKTVDDRSAIKSRLGGQLSGDPALSRPALAGVADRSTAVDARLEKPDSLRGRSESRERRRPSPAKDRGALDRKKSDKESRRKDKEDRGVHRGRGSDRKDKGHGHRKHREDEGRSRHRMHERGSQARDKSEAPQDSQKGAPFGEQKLLAEAEVAVKGLTQEQPPLAESKTFDRSVPRSPSVSSSSSSALSEEDSPEADAGAEALEPGQLPDSPRIEEEKGQGVLKSRWLDEDVSPENEGRAQELPGSGKKRRRESEEREDLGFKRRPASMAGSRSNLRIQEDGEIEDAGTPGIKDGNASMERAEKSASRGDSYERDLNKRELEELGMESEEEEEPGRPGSVSSDDEGVGNQATPALVKVNMLEGCRSVDEFERLNKIDEGTYGVVYKAKDKKSGEIVALKKVKMEKEREGFPMTSLREINILLSFDKHPSIVDVKEVVVGNNLDSIFMVMEYMEHDLKSLAESQKQPFTASEAKCLMLQLFEGTQYLHENWVLHRDLKTSNLLLNNKGDLKICDFGLARQYGSPLKAYTHMVVTLWYRAPELLLGSKLYSTAIDMWSLGCIMAELLSKEPLFPGKSEIDQIDRIFKLLGTPSAQIWPEFEGLPNVKNVRFVKQPYNKLREKFPPSSFTNKPTLSEAGFDLLNKLLTYDPAKRITAEQALNHEWFKEVPLPKDKELMPMFPARTDHDRRRRMLRSPDPLEEQRQREKRQPAGGSGLFGAAL